MRHNMLTGDLKGHLTPSEITIGDLIYNSHRWAEPDQHNAPTLNDFRLDSCKPPVTATSQQQTWAPIRSKLWSPRLISNGVEGVTAAAPLGDKDE